MAYRFRHKNSAVMLDLRARGFVGDESLPGHNSKILRAVILQDSREFVKVWTKISKSTVSYEKGKVYFENFQSCYSCIHSKPHRLYQLPNRGKSGKIEDALLCQSRLEKLLPKPSDNEPSLLALTASNCLLRLSAETGQELQKVFLSSRHKFRYIDWDVPQETFYLKSIQNTWTHLGHQTDQDTLIHLAIFNVFPLQIVGIMEIKKTVFGSTIKDAMLSEGVLIVSHSTKSVKFYSLEHILDKYLTRKLALGVKSHPYDIAAVGEAPSGIPVNIHLDACPPLLFEVTCADNAVQVGGHPWHYIYTPPHKRHKGVHHICSLEDNTLATNGIQDMNCSSLEGDSIFIHPDCSGRIVHVGPSLINVLKFRNEMKSGLPSEVVKDFSITAHRNNDAVSQVTVTSSGRMVKKRVQQLDDDPEQETFRMVEYEDELDLLVVVEVAQDQDGEGKAHIRLHDNKTGKLLRRIPLVESWDETYHHTLHLDNDSIVHIEQMKNNKFCCHVYKLEAKNGEA